MRLQAVILLLATLSFNVNAFTNLFNFLRGAPPQPKQGVAMASKYPIVGEEAIMSQKAHGTCEKPVQKDLRWK